MEYMKTLKKYFLFINYFRIFVPENIREGWESK